jgi:hypothetical protein
MINEVGGVEFSCNDTAIPYGDNYTEPEYRVCPNGQNFGGELVVDGTAFLESLDFTPSHMSADVAVAFGFWVLFTFLNCVALQYFEWTGGGYTKKVYKPGTAPKKGKVRGWQKIYVIFRDDGR